MSYGTKNKTQAGNRQKAALQVLGKTYDLDEAVDISEFDRSHVCVPPFCPHNCAVRDFCRYQQYLRSARGADVTVQVCNHNFLLADAEHRLQGIRPLLKEHHILVVDEAHKLPEAARQMYSRSVSQEKLRTFCRLLQREHLTREASRLAESQEALSATLERDDRLEEEARVTFVLTPPRARALEFAVTCLRQLAAHLTHCRSLCRTPSVRQSRSNIPACMTISRPWYCQICSVNCDRDLDGRSEQKRILVWWRFWTSAQKKGSDTVMLCWRRCLSAG